MDTIKKLTLSASIILCASLVACKQQSTMSQSSGAPSSSSPSSAGSSSPQSSSPSSSKQQNSGSSASSQNGKRPSRQAEQQQGSTPSSQQSSSPSAARNGEQGHTKSGDEQSPSNTGPDQQQSRSGTDSDTSGLPSGPGESSLYDSYDLDADTDENGESGGNNSDQDRPQNAEASGPLTQGSDRDRQATLEAELEGSIGQYDDMILRERDYVLNREAARGAGEQVAEDSPAGQGEGQGGNSTSINPYGEPGASQAGEDDITSNGNSSSPNGSGGRSGPGQQQGQAVPPADIPDGNDDDVVARQIREAAMNEKDPELREKLWQEYRKYKNQQ